MFRLAQKEFAKEKVDENEKDHIDFTAIYGIGRMRDNADRSKRAGYARPREDL
jgi:hypothetical protein